MHSGFIKESPSSQKSNSRTPPEQSKSVNSYKTRGTSIQYGYEKIPPRKIDNQILCFQNFIKIKFRKIVFFGQKKVEKAHLRKKFDSYSRARNVNERTQVDNRILSYEKVELLFVFENFFGKIRCIIMSLR